MATFAAQSKATCGLSAKAQARAQRTPVLAAFSAGAPTTRTLAGSKAQLGLAASQLSGTKLVSSVGAPAIRSSAARTAVTASAKPWTERDCRLVLEDGTVFHGRSCGAKGTKIGEVVFNTSLTGYQEIMTDPSYAGQFVCFTVPHIGNVGINAGDNESVKCHPGAIIIRDSSSVVSNYRSIQTLEECLVQNDMIGIADVDTRALTRILRDTGSLVGVVTTDGAKTDDELVAEAKGWSIVGKDMISQVTTKETFEWNELTEAGWEFSKDATDKKEYKVVAYDFGIKSNIMKRLASHGCNITVVPASTPAEEVMAMNPDGVFFSNGPGDPSAVPYAVEAAKKILGQVPVFGICMGHQVLGQAFGGSTYKLKFGHHGGNHPIKHGPTGRIEISAQNHNFAVDPATLPEGVEVTHVNLNDGTCAGMVWAEKKAMTIQYHPEASPGPHDADLSFGDFVTMMKAHKASK